MICRRWGFVAKKNPRSRGNKTPKSVLGSRKVRRAMKSAGARVSTKARYYANRSANRLHRRKYPQVGPHVANPPKMRKLTKSTGWIGATAVKIVKRRGQPDQVLIRRPRRRKQSK
jgi:hypothetical protein